MHVLRLPQFTNEEDRPKILGWMKRPGERVEVGDVLGELETQKATFLVEADRPGILLRLVASVGIPLEPRSALAIIGGEEEKAEAEAWVEEGPKEPKG